MDVPSVESLSATAGTWYGHLNPVTRPDISLYGETYTLGPPLTQEELDIFKAQFVTLLAAPGSVERMIMLDRLEAYVLALRAIKYKLNNPAFKGLNPAESELGFGLIRPVFTCNVALVPRITWAQALTVAYAAWFSNAAGTAGFQIGIPFGLCVTHLKSLTTPLPFMSEAQFTVGRTGVLIPVDVRNLRIADTVNQVSIFPVPSMILIPQTTFFAQARSDTVAASTDEVVLGGLVYGLGRALRQTVTYPAT